MTEQQTKRYTLDPEQRRAILAALQQTRRAVERMGDAAQAIGNAAQEIGGEIERASATVHAARWPMRSWAAASWASLLGRITGRGDSNF